MMKKAFTSITKYLPSSWSGKISVFILLVWIIIALFNPFLANNKPIIAKNETGWSFPVFSKSAIKENIPYNFQIDPIIPYRFDDLDLENTFKSPFSKGKKGIHLLGTDKLGRDVAAGMINGASVAFTVATLAILLSAIIGTFIGLIIGFYGDQGIKRNLLQQILLVLIFIYFIYYLTHIFQDGFTFYSLAPIIVLILLTFVINHLLAVLPFKKYGVPIDIFVQRLFEINESLPGLFIILALVAIVTKTSLMTISLILAFLIWMTFARYARAEALQIREEAFIQSARASGSGDVRLLIRHILPNALPSLLVVVAFAFSGVILLESTLSFLGIGLPLEEISWGKILAESRKSPKAWWLAVFPGLAIFLVLYSFNTIGDILANHQRNQK